MSDPREIMSAVNQRMNRILTVAEAALPQDQFQAYRKVVLEEFGRKGLARDIDDLCNGSSGKAMYGTGRQHPGMKGGSQ